MTVIMISEPARDEIRRRLMIEANRLAGRGQVTQERAEELTPATSAPR